MADHSNALRRAIITRLKADAGVAAIVGNRVKDQVEHNPTWPFIRYGFPLDRPYASSCGGGSEHDLTIHAFARGPGTTNIKALTAAIIDCLNDAPLSIENASAHYGIDWLDTQTMHDGAEVNDYHAVIRFSATVLD